MTGATDTQAAIQQRVAEIRRKHPGMRKTDAEPDAPAVVPCSVRTGPAMPSRLVHFAVSIGGEVLQDALATTERGTGNAVVTVVLQQRHGSLPVVAVRRYDSTPTSHAVAHSIAKRLRAGTSVHVHGTGIALADHDGQQMLRVVDVQAIEPPADPTIRKDQA